MANIKSAKKRILVIETKTLRNKMIKSKIKTLVKKVEAAVAANDKAAASAALTEAVVAIDKAAAKGVYHKNTAARKVSRITKAVNSIAEFYATIKQGPRVVRGPFLYDTDKSVP